MFENVKDLIIKENMIVKGDKIGVACSGGVDSMCLLHYLNSIKDEIGFSLCAINIDHGIRANSKDDSDFVVNYCKSNDITVYMYKVNAVKLSEDKNMSIELAAREARYGVFNALIKRDIVNKIALGHHQSDQAETILLNIFRGSGLSGACGMDYIRDDMYIRPMLNTPKIDIRVYATANDIPFVEDQTNEENEYSRNYIRNVIMPLLRNRWKNIDATLCSFGRVCRIDDNYIYSQINDDGVIYENESVVKIPVSYFVYPESIINRIIKNALQGIGCAVDFEKKHFAIVSDLALNGENGSRANFPNKLNAIKEYNYITFTNKLKPSSSAEYPMKRGKLEIKNYGILDIVGTKKLELGNYEHLIDANKVPREAVWRFRREGDTFTKFGGGTKTLKEYFVDKKIPTRLRDNIPLLAVDSDILVIAGVEISDKVKIDEDTKSAYGIDIFKF